MSRPRVATLALVVLAVPLACAEQLGPEAARADGEIRGGEVEKGHPAVGLLVFASGGICSGTLIAPDVVLTAGHCVDEGKIPEAFYTGQGRASERAAEATPEMIRYDVEAGEPVPGYVVAEACPKLGLDVGLVKLRAPVEGVQPARIEARAPEPREECVAVGFGRHPLDGGGATRAEKRSAVVTFREIMPGAFAFEDKTGGTEKGDSGGPLFCDGGLVAVNSCGNDPDRFARVDVAMPWIEAKLADWNATWKGGPIGALPATDAGAEDASADADVDAR